MRLHYIAVYVVGVGGASAAAMIFGEAALAFFLGVDVTSGEFGGYVLICFGAFQDVAHEEVALSCELMAGINISAGCDGDVFSTCAAAAESLAQAGTAVESYHKVEEIKRSAVLAPSFYYASEFFVFSSNLGDMVESERQLAVCHYGLDGNLIKAEIGNAEHIVGKIEVAAGVCPADVIFLIPSAGYELLSIFRHSVIAACSGGVFALAVVYLFASVYAYVAGFYLRGFLLLVFVSGGRMGCCLS